MTSAAEAALTALLFIAGAGAAAAHAGCGPAWAAGDLAQHEEAVRREAAGLDKTMVGIREEIERVSEAPAGRPHGQEHGGAARRGQDRFDPAAIRIASLESEIGKIEELKADLAGLDIVTVLAPGTADSVPSTEGVRFKVIVSPDVVTGFKHRAAGGITIDLEPGGWSGTIHVGIPAGLPHRGAWLDPALGHLLKPVAPFSALRGVGYAHGECYTFVSATVSSASSIHYSPRRAGGHDPAAAPLHGHSGPDIPRPRSELHGRWLDALGPPAAAPAPLPPVVSPPIPGGCEGVAIEPPFDPPLRQVRGDGVHPKTAACNEGLVLRVRGEEALCLRPETAERLLAAGILELPNDLEETLVIGRPRLQE